MNAGKAIYYLLSNASSVTDICGTRIYPELAEQEAPTPFVVYEVISVDPDDTNDGPAKMDEVSVDITAVADSYDTCADLASAIRSAIDRVRGTYNGVNVDSIQYSTTDTDVFDSPRRYAMTAGFIIRISRDDAQIATGQPIDLLTILRLADTPSTYGTTGQALVMNAAGDALEWGETASALDDLTDVNAPEPLDRQALTYDETTGEWIADGVGQVVIPVRNNSPSQTLNKGLIVAFAGTQGDRILVEPWDNASPSAYIVGVLSENLAGGADGHAQTYGEIRALNTSAYSLNTILYASGSGTFTTTANSLPVATVTRVHDNTGRIFVRLYVPGDHYRDRFRAEATAAATAHSVAPAGVETYYTAQANGDGFRQAPGSDTPRTEGDVVRRTIYWKAGAFAAINAGGFTEVALADDSTYAQLLAAIDDILNANGAPITIWSKREEVTPSAAILDGYTDDLVGAFAPALLVPDYSGPCMRIRRSGDNAEQDIGFDGIDLDRDAIANFCSPGDGFVKTWYNQDGSGNDATQATAANQPKIYDASTGVELENAVAATTWNGTSNQLATPLTIGAATPSTSFAIVTADSVSPNRRIYNMHDGAAGDERNSTFFNSQFNIFDGTNGLTTGTAVAGTQYLITSRFVTGDGTIHANGTLQGTSAAITQKSVNTLSIGKQDVGVAFYFDGKMQAVIIYAADKSADRADIETAINGYFNIYP